MALEGNVSDSERSILILSILSGRFPAWLGDMLGSASDIVNTGHMNPTGGSESYLRCRQSNRWRASYQLQHQTTSLCSHPPCAHHSPQPPILQYVRVSALLYGSVYEFAGQSPLSLQ